MKKSHSRLLYVIFLLCFSFLSSVSAQRNTNEVITFSSVVKDESGNRIANATIYGNEGAVMARSDVDGNFTIDILPVFTNLLVEAQGYESKVVTIDIEDGIVLQESPFLWGENNNINIPFTSIKHGEMVNSTIAVNADEVMRYDIIDNVFDIIESRVPGLIGTTNIRGIGNALVVIDGIPRDINSVNIQEIDQITVLKDVNATVLYGTQAKNGVILITTKRGDPLKRQINVIAERGMSAVTELPNYLNSADYMTLYNEALRNDGINVPRFSPELIANHRNPDNIYRYPSVDYYSDEFLRSFKNTNRVLTEFSGGNQNTRYYTNLGWINTGSIFQQGEPDVNNRLNARGNIDFRVNDFITSYLDAVVVFDIHNSPNGNFWNNAATLHPYYYSLLLPANMVTDTTLIQTARLINDEYILGGTTQYQDNVYGNKFLAGKSTNIRRTAQFNGGVDVDLDQLTDGLKFRSYLSFDFYNQYRQHVTNTYAVYDPTWDENDQIVSLSKINEDVSTGVQNLGSGGLTRRIGGYGMFDYNKIFDDVHQVSGQLLGYYNTIDHNDVLITQKHAHVGLRLAYNYQQRYFADFSSNYAHSIKLPENNRGGFSPSLGLAWVLSNEDFWAQNNTIDYLKLKASAGILNTDASMGYYLYDESYWFSGTYGWGDGAYSGNIVTSGRSANPHLGFEKMKSLNVGVESYLINRQFGVELNYFYNQYSDQVIRRTNYYPAYLSSLYPDENYGADAYNGVDLGLSWNRTIRDFSFNIGGNLLYANSEVITRDELWAYDYLYRTGQPTDALFGLESIGFFKDQEDIDNSPIQSFGEVQPGDIKYKDVNNDGIIDENDMMKIGNSQAKFSYGMHVVLKYRNLDLFILGNGRTGYQYYQSGDYFWLDGNAKYSEVALDRWTPETAETATYPRLSSKSNTNNHRNSTFWLKDGAFFNLNRVQLTYTLPQSWVSTAPIKEASIYLRGSNLLLVSKDARFRQLNVGTEPQYRNFGLGARILF